MLDFSRKHDVTLRDNMLICKQMNSTTWLYGAEVLPVGIRSKVMGLAAASHFIVNVAITEAGPSAFANIRENYYYVFVGCTAFFLVIGYFYFPETRRKTLEEIAAAFGDKVIDVDENHMPGEDMMGQKDDIEDSAEVKQVEVHPESTRRA